MKKFPVIGMVLVAASAITAAFVPSNAQNQTAALADGVLRVEAEEGDGLSTCSFADGGIQCSWSETGVTSATGGASVSSTLSDDTQTGAATTFG